MPDEINDHRLRIGLLGPLLLTVDGTPVDVPGDKRRAVLALLTVGAPEPVSTDRLVDAVWPDDPPASGRAALQSLVSRLRRHLGPFAERLTSEGSGYRLLLHPDELDVAEFEALLREGRQRGEAEPAAACDALRPALALWRGPPLEELGHVEPLRAWSRATTEQWLGASELLAGCALAGGDAAAAAEAATEALAVDPLREASALLLMRALADQQRGADALRVGHDLRTRLREQTGLDPSPALAQLEAEIAAGATEPAEPPTAPMPAAGPLFGREAELAGLMRLVGSPRLVTIVGPAGVGKTRLATEVARRSAATQAVAMVDLAALTDPAAVPEVLARSLGVEAGAGDSLARSLFLLRQRRSLLVLDNCEHLLDAVRSLITTLVAGCPDLTVLATSRERLAVPGEQTSTLAPLPMPGLRDGERTEAVPSVALFLEHAQQVRPGFAPDNEQLGSVARIVRALDGLPLAIELAAGRMSSLALEDLEARLDRALDLLGGATVDALGRHRTLRAAVQWSYDLLTPAEQQLFRHLAVFPGGFDLATAESVAHELTPGDDPVTMLAHLVDSSMVVADLDGTPRYRMLDTLRRFGLDRLDAAGELEVAQATLLRWAADLAAWLDAAYETDDEPQADRRLRIELPNLRAAWRLARDTGDLGAAASLAVDLYTHASWRELTELSGWSLALAEDPDLVGHPWEARVLGAAAEAAWSSSGDLGRAERYAQRGIAAIDPDDERGRALATWALADVYLFTGRLHEAAELAIEARQGTRWIAEGYAQAAIAMAYAGDLARAEVFARQCAEEVGGPTLRAYSRYIDGELANLEGDFSTAKAAYREAIDGANEVGASFVAGIASVGLVTAQAADGDTADALAGYRSLIDLWERTGAWTQQWTTLRNLAALLDQLGDGEAAASLQAAADRAPEAASVAGAERTPLDDDERAAANRTNALRVARDAITRALDEQAARTQDP